LNEENNQYHINNKKKKKKKYFTVLVKDGAGTTQVPWFLLGFRLLNC
jgi:hypothetical protein